MRKNLKRAEYRTFFNMPFLLLFVYNILFCMSYGMISPILIQYLTWKGIAVKLAGSIAGVVSITSLLVRPLSGYLVDHLNKKYLLIVASILLGIAMFGLSLSSSIGWMIFFRICQGIGFAINGTCCIAMAIAYMPQERLGEGIGYFGVANIVSTSVAPAIGIELADRLGYVNTIMLAGCSVLAAGVCMILFRYYHFESKERFGQSIVAACESIRPRDLFSLRLLPLALFVAAFSLANSIVSSYLASHCQAIGMENYSMYFTINAIVMVATRPFLGKLSDKKGASVVLFPAYLLAAAAMLLISRASAIWMIYLAAVLKALGQGSGQPTLQAECLKRLGPSKRGLATSTFYVGSDVANGLGPIIGAFVVEKANYAASFDLSAVILAVAFVGYFVYTHRSASHKAPLAIDDRISERTEEQ